MLRGLCGAKEYHTKVPFEAPAWTQRPSCKAEGDEASIQAKCEVWRQGEDTPHLMLHLPAEVRQRWPFEMLSQTGRVSDVLS